MLFEKHQTDLEEHGPPVFPKAIDRLNTFYDAWGISEIHFEILEMFIPESYFWKYGATTLDGYKWPFAFVLKKRTETFLGSIPVLFPQKGSDRSIAVYPEKGKCTEEDAAQFCEKIADAIEQIFLGSR